MAFRRSVKNISKNYAPCERDVREATSNDRKLAPAAIMARISNATYDVQQSPLVMAMLWKRLNDMGKNWRHVYKGLLVLDYLLKTGADHVVKEVTENKFAIQTLVDFRYVDSKGVDKGMNVREQAKVTLSVLEDPTKLQAERDRALAQHRRFTQSLGRKAEPKPVQASRAHTLAKKGMVMPNGEVPPDPREEELRQIERAREFSYVEYQAEHSGAFPDGAANGGLTSPVSPGAASLGSPTAVPVAANGTEEEQLAYALQISALEAQQQATVGSQPMSPHQRDATLAQREEEELAMALSLSLAEVQGAAQAVDSDDEASDDSVTPPNSPYQGEFFGGEDDMMTPPSYQESIGSNEELGVVPNDAVSEVESHDSLPSALDGASLGELEQYLAADASFGEESPSPVNPHNPYN